MRPHPGGARWENFAVKYLRPRGLEVLERNYATRLGEIDLIMQSEEGIVFVEVRYRHSERFGGSLASVTATKQRRMTCAAQQFLSCHPKLAQQHCRFDVIAVSGSPFRPSVNWIRNAFEYRE